MTKKPIPPDKHVDVTYGPDKSSDEKVRKPEFQAWSENQLDDRLARSVVEAIKQGRGFLSLCHVFDEFDPLSGSVDDWPLNGVAQRARDIVGNRSSKEFRYGAMWTEWMVQQDLAQVEDAEGAELFRYGVPWPRVDLLPHILLQRVSEFDITDVNDFPNATWPELFAVLALAYVGRWAIARPEHTPIDAVMAATEAIEIAELLRDQAEHVMRRGKLGGRAKDQRRYQPWRRLAVEFWKSSSYSTYTQAAEAFLKEYREDMATRSGLSRNRPVTNATVARWMSHGANAKKGPPI